jgi:hypothetical protein
MRKYEVFEGPATQNGSRTIKFENVEKQKESRCVCIGGAGVGVKRGERVEARRRSVDAEGIAVEELLLSAVETRKR